MMTTIHDDIDDLVQDCSISSALAIEILQSFTKPRYGVTRLQWAKHSNMGNIQMSVGDNCSYKWCLSMLFLFITKYLS